MAFNGFYKSVRARVRHRVLNRSRSRVVERKMLGAILVASPLAVVWGFADTAIAQPVEPVATEAVGYGVFSAEQWALEDSEWQRYQSLMQGIRGSVSPRTLLPIEVLGIHARSAGERRRYAEQWAMMMQEDAERILAFQRAYDEAQRRLFPDNLLINGHRLASLAQTPASTVAVTNTWAWQAEDRVLFFTNTECPTCDAVLERLLSQRQQFSGIDLYFLDVPAGEERRLREWAAAHHIKPAWVSERTITLNLDAGAFQQVVGHRGQSAPVLPVVILRRAGQLITLPTSQL